MVLNFKVTFAKTYNGARKLDNNNDKLLQRQMIRHKLKNCLQPVMIKVKIVFNLILRFNPYCTCVKRRIRIWIIFV